MPQMSAFLLQIVQRCGSFFRTHIIRLHLLHKFPNIFQDTFLLIEAKEGLMDGEIYVFFFVSAIKQMEPRLVGEEKQIGFGRSKL